MPKYIDQLSADMAQFGYSSQAATQPKTYLHLCAKLRGFSTYLQDRAIPAKFPDHSDLLTSLGKHTLDAYNAGLNFTIEGLSHCSWAEPRLLENIKKIGDEYHITPVIVTNNNVPVAVWKTNGDPTLYGLEDDYENGIVAGVFSTAHAPIFDPRDLPPTKNIWTVPIDFAGYALPGRFSSFSTPLTSRRLSCDDPRQSTALTTTHAQIQAQVGAHIGAARPIEDHLISLQRCA